MRAEQRQRHRAARDGDEPIGAAEHQREGRRRRHRDAEQSQHQEGAQQGGEREAHHPQGMQILAERKFDEPRADLRRPEQRADPHRGGGVDAGARENRQQMRRQSGRHESVSGESRGHQNERQALRRQQLLRRLDVAGFRHGGFGAAARQQKRMQRRADQSEQRGVNQISAAPAGRFDEEMRRRPARRRGKAAGERQRRDRPARGGAEDTAERAEGGIIQARRHRHAEHDPHREIGDRVFGMADQHQAERAGERAAGHHDMAAKAVDRPADKRRDQTGGQKRDGKSGH